MAGEKKRVGAIPRFRGWRIAEASRLIDAATGVDREDERKFILHAIRHLIAHVDETRPETRERQHTGATDTVSISGA